MQKPKFSSRAFHVAFVMDTAVLSNLLVTLNILCFKINGFLNYLVMLFQLKWLYSMKLDRNRV